MKAFCCFLCAAFLAVPVFALAQEKEEAESAVSFEVLDAKICSGIKDKEPIDEKAKFSTGEKAWVWLKLRPKGETELRLASIAAWLGLLLPRAAVRAGMVNPKGFPVRPSLLRAWGLSAP